MNFWKLIYGVLERNPSRGGGKEAVADWLNIRVAGWSCQQITWQKYDAKFWSYIKWSVHLNNGINTPISQCSCQQPNDHCCTCNSITLDRPLAHTRAWTRGPLHTSTTDTDEASLPIAPQKSQSMWRHRLKHYFALTKKAVSHPLHTCCHCFEQNR